MTPIIGALGAAIVIVALFRFDRPEARLSKAMWVPFAWLLIASSRPVSAWIMFGVPGTATNEYIDGSPLDRNILTLLLALGLLTLAMRSRQARSIISANPTIILFFAYCLISLCWADYPFVVFKRWIRAVGDIVMVLVIITEPNWQAALKWIFSRIAYLLIPLSIVFIRFYPSLGRYYSRGGVPEWTGVGTDKNALGMICMLYGISILWRAMAMYRDRGAPNRTRDLVAMGTVFLMILYLLHAADSKTADAGFVMAGTLIVVTSLGPKFRRPAFLTSMVAGMVGVSFCVLFLGIGSGALTAIGRNATLTGRTEVWQTVLPYAKNPWIGAGYENFWIGERIQIFNRILGGLNQAHNGYIEIYLNIGWIGLILLGLIILTGYRNILNGFRADPAISRLKLAFFFLALIYNFTEATFKMMSPVWILFLWAVLAVPQRQVAEIPPADSESEFGSADLVPVGALDETSSVADWT